VPLLVPILEAQAHLACAQLCAQHHAPDSSDAAANALSKLYAQFKGLAWAAITTTLARHSPPFTAAIFQQHGDRSLYAVKVLRTIHPLSLSEAHALVFAEPTA
jgi:hypothetical protein